MPLERLILVRHGEAEARAPSGEDADRRLTAEGRRQSRAAGQAVAAAVGPVDLALVSTAARALGTWTEIEPVLLVREHEARDDLYLAEPEPVLSAAIAAGVASVMVVGHNPGLHALACDLAERGSSDPVLVRKIQLGFPTGAAAIFRIETGRPVAEAMIVPEAAT